MAPQVARVRQTDLRLAGTLIRHSHDSINNGVHLFGGHMMAKNMSFHVRLGFESGTECPEFKTKEIICGMTMSFGLPDLTDDNALSLVNSLFFQITMHKRASILLPRPVTQIIAVLAESLVRPESLMGHIVQFQDGEPMQGIKLIDASITALTRRGDAAWIDLIAKDVDREHLWGQVPSDSGGGGGPDDGSQ